MIFGAVSAAMVTMFNNFTKSVSDNVSELVNSESSSEMQSYQDD